MRITTVKINHSISEALVKFIDALIVASDEFDLQLKLAVVTANEIAIDLKKKMVTPKHTYSMKLNMAKALALVIIYESFIIANFDYSSHFCAIMTGINNEILKFLN